MRLKVKSGEKQVRHSKSYIITIIVPCSTEKLFPVTSEHVAPATATKGFKDSRGQFDHSKHSAQLVFLGSLNPLKIVALLIEPARTV